MTTSIISVCVLALGLALVCVEVYGHGMPCDKMIEFSCGDKGKEMGQKWLDKMTPECKTKFEGMKEEFTKKKTEICAGKADQDKTCKALKEMGQEKMQKMGKECMPKMSCEMMVKINCIKDMEKVKKMDDEITSKMSDDCLKKWDDNKVEMYPKIHRACGETNEARKCENFKRIMTKSRKNLGECMPKWDGEDKKEE